MVLPLPIVVVLLLVQCGALVMGFLGPPGGRARPALMVLLLGTGLVLLPAGIGAVAAGQARTGTLMVWAGVVLLSCSARLVRAPERGGEDEDDGGGGGGGGPGPGPEPRDPQDPQPDWDAFDREREAWALRRAVGSR